ncbi:uncharacterized protein YndB with AHSA1/START domain [Dysgonomonadaceae bacterium PH5-43]|nr:uncharacterized protein YndB with AHSA1/START domain [Dysgonomonadaceae bacterium PH5-43]
MKKEKFKTEYIFNKCSKNSLWSCLSSSSGLAEWFADEVSDNANIFTFVWDKYPTQAELISVNPYASIRFRWTEEDSETFFEFRINQDEITGACVLEITDFAEPNDKTHAINLWDTQVKELRRKLGV